MFWYPNLDYLDQNEAQGLVTLRLTKTKTKNPPNSCLLRTQLSVLFKANHIVSAMLTNKHKILKLKHIRLSP